MIGATSRSDGPSVEVAATMAGSSMEGSCWLTPRTMLWSIITDDGERGDGEGVGGLLGGSKCMRQSSTSMTLQK